MDLPLSPLAHPAPASKADYRARFRVYRAGLDDATFERTSRAIARRVVQLPAFEAAQTVLGYWPLLDRREIDTRAILREVQAQKKQLLLPVVRTFGGSAQMDACPAPDLAQLRPNRWGVQEPDSTRPVAPSTIDLVLVPALGADLRGHRLGYGAGYYDRFLRGTSARRVGLVYEECLVAHLPAEPHDEALDLVVTERRVVTP